MKKLTHVALLVALTAFAGLSGCSSGQIASTETPAMPLEAPISADQAAAASAEPSPGAVIDTATPSTTVAENSAYTPRQEKSPVNLGASSAGRAH